MPETRAFEWRHDVRHFQDLGLALPQEQHALALQGEGLALTLQRVLDPSGEGEWVVPHPLPDGSARYCVLPAVLDFGPDHVLEYHWHGEPRWASETLEDIYGEAWSGHQSLVGLLGESPLWWSDGDLVVRRVWDCWPITQQQAVEVELAVDKAWNASRYSLLEYYEHMCENQVDIGFLEMSQPEFATWMHDLSKDGEVDPYDVDEVRVLYEVHHALFDEHGSIRELVDPESLLVLPPDIAPLWRRLLRSSERNWHAAAAGDLTYPNAASWLHAHEGLSPWL